MKFLLLPVKIHIVPVPSLWSQGQYRLWSATETVSSGATISWLLDDSCKFYSNSYFHTCKKKILIAIIQSYCLLKISWFSVKVEHISTAKRQASPNHLGDMLAQQLSMGRTVPQSNSSNLSSLHFPAFCSLMQCTAANQTGSWMATHLQHRLTSHLSNENRLGLAVKQMNSRWKAMQEAMVEI